MTGKDNSFSFTGIPKILFGRGICSRLGEYVSSYGSEILLITGNASYGSTRIAGNIEASLRNNNIKWHRLIVAGEPSPMFIDSGVKEFKTVNIDAVVAVGGGSVLDSGKAMAAMLMEEGNVRIFLEGVGDRKPSGVRLPLIVLPTTAGTGSEVTINAVITEPGERGFKKSLRHERYMPDVALIDPELTVDCPPEITAASGMDAFTQLLESFQSTKANPLTDTLAFSALKSISRSLLKAFLDGSNMNAREDMSYAALISGITLVNAGLGVLHGFAQPLGSIFPIPHGVVCGTLMGAANRITVEKLRAINENNFALEKYAKAGRLFSNNKFSDDSSNIDFFLDTIDKYIDVFKLPRLKTFGVSTDDLDAVIELTDLKYHPVELNKDDLLRILRMRL